MEPRMSELVKAGAVDLWAERREEGPDVQPFQEVPEEFNNRLDAFWREAEAAH
jgi:hypothetical protein